MKITRDKMFFSKDLIHTLAYVGMFVAAIISVGACKSGIWGGCDISMDCSRYNYRIGDYFRL